MKIPWETALMGVFIAGVLFMILSLLKIREKIINVIPLGFILYPISMMAMKKTKEVHPIMYVLCCIFVGYFVYVV